jgi:hypothetical protein
MATNTNPAAVAARGARKDNRLAGSIASEDSQGRSHFQLIVAPADRRGTFHADLHGRRLCTSRTPLCSAARVLLSEGVAPGIRLVMRHAGADYDSLTTTVGVAAKLTVKETEHGPKFKRWTGTEPPPMREKRPAAIRHRAASGATSAAAGAAP